MVVPLSEGSYTVDITKKFIPFDPSIDSIMERPGSLLVDIVPFLIKTTDELIVIDPGLGLEHSVGSFTIHENINRAGYSYEDVTLVLLSHLHKDHAGGICYPYHDSFRLMFPEAKYFCQKKEMEHAITMANSPSIQIEKLEFLRNTTNLEYMNGNGILKPGIFYEISGGHTQFHQVFTIVVDRQSYFFGGDVLPQPKQLQMRYIAKYDYDGTASAAKRIEYGKRAAETNGICLFFHSSQMPGAKIKMDQDDRFLLENAALSEDLIQNL